MIRRLLPLVLLLACDASVPDGDPLLEPDPGLDSDTDTEPPAPFDLAAAISTDAMLDHLEALQAIADDNENNRVYLSSGYLDSVDYVIDVAERAGFTPIVDTYPIVRYSEEPPEAALTAPGDAARDLTVEIFAYSGSGEVEADLVGVDLLLPIGDRPPNSSTSGCAASDFSDFPSGAVALIQRGTCTFAIKVANAEAAGASAVMIFNEGQSGRRELLDGVLSDDALASIPVVGLSYTDGAELAGLDAARVRLSVQTTLTQDTDRNVLITLPGRDPTRSVLVGAHLDSVAAGPGINDNGSGTAFLLEMMERAVEGGWQPETDLTLAWWGAEEQGLVGSRNYFLTEDGEPDLDNLATTEAYLNFDMLASPNGARFLYDGDASSTNEDIANPGSVYIEELFAEHFESEDLETRPVAIVTRSDSYWAVALGLPWGGLFSGAEQPKSAPEALVYGGVAGDPYDACYHLACDDVLNIDPQLYTELSVAGAAIVQRLAESPTPPPGSSSFAPGDDGPRVGELRQDLPRPYGCHDHAVFDR